MPILVQLAPSGDPRYRPAPGNQVDTLQSVLPMNRGPSIRPVGPGGCQDRSRGHSFGQYSVILDERSIRGGGWFDCGCRTADVRLGAPFSPQTPPPKR